MSTSKFKRLLGSLAMAATALSAQAQMAQDPLLSRSAAVEPNIVFMFDDSGSMTQGALYQFGGSPGGLGMTGPGGSSSGGGLTTNIYASQSPDVNLMWYDPRKTYSRRIKFDGVFLDPGPVTGLSSFNVYFYKASTGQLKVNTVTVGNGGTKYPATGITATFAAPASGPTATATVVMASTQYVSGVTTNTAGIGYAVGTTVIFTSPPGTGIRATGTPIFSNRYSVSSVTVSPGGTGYPASGVTAAFTPAPAGGVTATGTVTIAAVSTGSLSAFNVTNGGSGYPTTGLAGTFAAAPLGGTTATGTVTTTTTYSVGSITQSATGSGYPGSTTATFNAPPAGGVQATATVKITGGKLTVTLKNAGAGYTSPPILTITGGAGTGANPVANAVGSASITSVAITNPGSGYTTAPAFTLTPGTVGAGSGATFTRALGTTNKISGITVNTAGSGYIVAPTITLSGVGSGSGASFAVNTTAASEFSGIAITDPGSGYTSPPTISFGSAGRNVTTTASFTATTANDANNNYISAINVTAAGTGYITTPTLTLSGTGTGSGASYTVNMASAGPATFSNQKWDGTGVPILASDYYVLDAATSATGYTPPLTALETGATTGLSYPVTASSTVTIYPRFKGRTDCSGASCSWAEEQQNYANWNAYHNTRLNLAKTGMGLAFQPLNPTFRLGWGTINTLGSASPALDKGVRLYSDAVVSPAATSVKEDFFTWMYALNTNGSTPNRIAVDNVGKYYKRADDGGPWATTTTGNTAISSSAAGNVNHASCRRSYALLMTDGYYNDSFTLADQDSNATALAAVAGTPPYQYLPVGPYSDTAGGTKFADTFADVAMKYWGTDLRPDLSNAIKATDSDPAYWQHMNFYAIGLGVVGTLDQSDPQVLKKLSGQAPDRTIDWPTPVTNTQTAIDDMWHATVNGRGKMFNARTASELTTAISQMLSDVSGAEGTQAGVAVSTVNLSTGTKKYTPSYTPITWTGNVTAYWLDKTNGAQAAIPAWQVETKISTDPITKINTYSEFQPSHVERNIVVGNGSTSGTRAALFNFAAMSSANLIGTMNGNVNDNMIKYLRGERTNEDNIGNTFSTTAIYRPRENVMGDVVNSTPVFVKNTVNLKYENVSGPTTGSYATFLTAKNNRPEGVLVVGANDGMLHVFRDGTGDKDAPLTPGGAEVFAYVPNAILPTLNKLSDKTYVHQYYVDGPNIETDAYFKNGTPRWANIVVGSTGGGAGAPATPGVSPKSAVFAIDMTNLNTSAEPASFNTSSVLWEVSSKDSANYSELGHVLTDIQAGPTLDGSWTAIFGNGYDSKSCQARLFVVNIETGAKIKEINTGVGTCSAAGKNGLGGVRIVRNSNQQIIGAYAGDLQGNLWKFSLNDANPANWKVDLAGSPLYQAGATKPITALPTVLELSSVTIPDTGRVVVFGTGKFYEATDITSVTQQTLYGILDQVEFGAATIPAGTALTNNSLLVQQTISSAGDINGTTYYSVSTNPVAYLPVTSTSKRGWYIDLPNTGQRMVYPMDLLVNRYVAADTISPFNVSPDPCSNTTGGTGFLYFIDALTGAGPATQILDTNGKDGVTSADALVSGFKGKADGRNVSLIVDTNSSRTNLVNCSAGDPTCTLVTFQCVLTNTCIIPNPASIIKSREWRQLFMR
jgi:type IV pilus assembly protein PilY1